MFVTKGANTRAPSSCCYCLTNHHHRSKSRREVKPYLLYQQFQSRPVLRTFGRASIVSYLLCESVAIERRMYRFGRRTLVRLNVRVCAHIKYSIGEKRHNKWTRTMKFRVRLGPTILLLRATHPRHNILSPCRSLRYHTAIEINACAALVRMISRNNVDHRSCVLGSRSCQEDNPCTETPSVPKLKHLPRQ